LPRRTKAKPEISLPDFPVLGDVLDFSATVIIMRCDAALQPESTVLMKMLGRFDDSVLRQGCRNEQERSYKESAMNTEWTQHHKARSLGLLFDEGSRLMHPVSSEDHEVRTRR